MFRLEWTDRGLLEFESALALIADEHPGKAQLVKDRTFKTIKHLEYFSLGTPAPSGTFKIYVPKTSHFLMFRRDAKGDIKLCAFLHAARDWEEVDWETL